MADKEAQPTIRGSGSRGRGTQPVVANRGGRGAGVAPIFKKEKVPTPVRPEETSKVHVVNNSGVKDLVIVTITDGSRHYQVNLHRPIGANSLPRDAFIASNPQQFVELTMRAKDPRAQERTERVRLLAMQETQARFQHLILEKDETTGRPLLRFKDGAEFKDLLERDDQKVFKYRETKRLELDYYKNALEAHGRRLQYETKAGPSCETRQNDMLRGFAGSTASVMDAIQQALVRGEWALPKHSAGQGAAAWTDDLDDDVTVHSERGHANHAEDGKDPLEREQAAASEKKRAPAAGFSCT